MIFCAFQAFWQYRRAALAACRLQKPAKFSADYCSEFVSLWRE
jgi:hypothetical protein